MKRFFREWILFLTLVGFSSPVSAIVVADYGVATNAPTGSYDVDWDCVHNYRSSSGVAVGSHWLLTAAHVAIHNGTSTLVIGGTNYYEREIIFHRAADDPNHTQQADLALVRFDKEFPETCPLYTGGFPSVPLRRRLDAVLVGYGTTGTVFDAYYTMSGSGKGIRRWGSNKIDQAEAAPVEHDIDENPNDDIEYWVSDEGIQILFTSGDTSYEAGVGIGDSGGGTFVEEDGVWKLAGINTLTYGNETAGQYAGSFAVSVPAYYAWATNVMNSTGDLDSDGIPNFWEQQFGTTTGVVASVDQDSDGFTGEEEYIADTDPTSSASFFRVDDLSVSDHQTFTFEGSTARKYQVLYTTNDLVDPSLTWISNGIPVWGEGAATEITVTNSEEMVFYRVWVSLP